MKKILFTIALVMTMAFCANAQRDGFFSDWQYEDRTITDIGNGLALPHSEIGSFENGNGNGAPLGSGLLIVTALGGGYALIRKKRR